jgi:hypothetical protein
MPLSIARFAPASYAGRRTWRGPRSNPSRPTRLASDRSARCVRLTATDAVTRRSRPGEQAGLDWDHDRNLLRISVQLQPHRHSSEPAAPGLSPAHPVRESAWCSRAIRCSGGNGSRQPVAMNARTHRRKRAAPRSASGSPAGAQCDAGRPQAAKMIRWEKVRAVGREVAQDKGPELTLP